MSELKTAEAPTRHSAALKWAQGFVVVALFATAILFAIRLVGVIDTDLWWHMAIGRWIAEHGSIPRTEPFSALGAGKPFEAYSWLFELLVFWCFKAFGPVGIVGFSSITTVAIAYALHRMVRRLNSGFLSGIGITFLAIYTMGRLYTPRPWLPSMFFFVLELDILMRVRKTGKYRSLYWLPAIFAIWVNVHIQFVDGLVVLGIALFEALLTSRLSWFESKFRVHSMAGVFVACVAATLINPYGAKIYVVAYELVTQGAALRQLPELSAIPFRNLDDWCVLIIALAATVALARTQKVPFFEFGLLAFSIVVSCRSQRDIWVLAIAGTAILASHVASRSDDKYHLTAAAMALVTLSTAVVGALMFAEMGVQNFELQKRIEDSLPVGAANAIKLNDWNGPLYNDYGWGGYLIWSLREPVSMYGRNTVYGVEKVLRANETWGGYPGWDSDPDLLRAKLIVAKRGAPLVQLLKLQGCLQAAYEDQIAVVFIPSSPPSDVTLEGTLCAARQRLKR